jgi:hypothetical protein
MTSFCYTTTPRARAHHQLPRIQFKPLIYETYLVPGGTLLMKHERDPAPHWQTIHVSRRPVFCAIHPPWVYDYDIFTSWVIEIWRSFLFAAFCHVRSCRRLNKWPFMAIRGNRTCCICWHLHTGNSKMVMSNKKYPVCWLDSVVMESADSDLQLR